MTKLSVEERLEVAIRSAAKDAIPTQSSREAAEDLYSSEPKLFDHFARQWVVEKLALLIRHHRAKDRAENDPQMLLGFAVPKSIAMKTGKRIPFEQATLRKLRQYRAIIWKDERKHKHPAVAKLDQAIELMKRYVPEHPGIKYEQVREMEIERLKS